MACWGRGVAPPPGEPPQWERSIEHSRGGSDRLPFPDCKIASLAFTPDGKMLASAGADTTIRIWDVKTGQHKATLNGHTDQVCSVAFSPDGKSIASGSLDNTVRLWNPSTGRCTATFAGHTKGVSSVAFNRDGKTLAVSVEYEPMQLWEIPAPAKLGK